MKKKFEKPAFMVVEMEGMDVVTSSPGSTETNSDRNVATSTGKVISDSPWN